MTATITITAGAKIQLSTGEWATLNSSRIVSIISERFGIYKVLLNGKHFSVDYKYVTVNT